MYNGGNKKRMKSYSCKICDKRGERFAGTRGDVRHHIRWEHLIKSSKAHVGIGVKHESLITPNMEVIELN